LVHRSGIGPSTIIVSRRGASISSVFGVDGWRGPSVVGMVVGVMVSLRLSMAVVLCGSHHGFGVDRMCNIKRLR